MFDLIVRLSVLLGIFGSVFLLSQLMLGRVWSNRERFAAVNKRLRMIRQGMGSEEITATLRKNSPSEFKNLPPALAHMAQGFQRMLFSAAVPYTASQVLVGLAAFFLAVLAIALLVAGMFGVAVNAGVVLLLAVVAAAIAIGLPIMVLNYISQRKRKKIEAQFPVALDVFVRALRSGHPVAGAIDLLTREMEDPIGSEFGLIADEVAYGADLTDAIEAMADRWDLEDIRMFVVSLSVQMETGGNLAEILENLADVIRARASLYMKVRSLSSEGRMTGWMLTILPIVTFIGMFSVNPGFYLNVAKDPIFLFGMPALLLLYFIGVFWIRHLVNIKV
jgi:tight adherence protein B